MNDNGRISNFIYRIFVSTSVPERLYKKIGELKIKKG